MSVRHLLATAAVTAQPLAASVSTLSPGRLGAATGALLGLAGVIVAVRELARPARRSRAAGRSLRAVVALAAGLLGLALGALVAATADGGLGTGNGLGGAYVAMLAGLICAPLAALALARSRRDPVRGAE